LAGKKAIITGCDSGIGRAVAIAYAREGADILIAYLDEDEDEDEVGVLWRGRGERPFSCPAISGILTTAVRSCIVRSTNWGP
jgi:NAD(P)-dependent dehydrogenase (short-subunit alcohol dehydrogenase family)